MEKIMVLGAGTMGAGIAQAFADHGHAVLLFDLRSDLVERGVQGIARGLAKLVEKGKLEEAARASTLAHIETTTDMARAAECGLVIEAVVENMEVKKQIFRELDAVVQAEAILASNTSSLSITEIASATGHPERVIGMHFFNPAPVMKLVELIRGMATSDETFARAQALAQAIGKEPVEVAEAPGFVVNRILVPLVNEAVCILQEGVASAEDIDNAMKNGAGHPMGPLALGDLIGLDVCLAVMDVLYAETGDPKFRACTLLRKYVRAGWLGRKSGRGFFTYG